VIQKPSQPYWLLIKCAAQLPASIWSSVYILCNRSIRKSYWFRWTNRINMARSHITILRSKRQTNFYQTQHFYEVCLTNISWTLCTRNATRWVTWSYYSGHV